jgi:hypothetical protein
LVSCCSKEKETDISKEKQSDSVFSSEEKNYPKNSLKNKKVMKKAVVKLKRLTLNEIDKYTGKEYNKTRKNISESPPDLGPPNDVVDTVSTKFMSLKLLVFEIIVILVLRSR